MTVPQFFSPAQVAERLQVDPSTVSRWIRAGRFPGAVRLSGRAIRIPAGDLQRLLQGARVFSGGNHG